MAVTRSLRQIAPVRLRAEVVHGFGRGSRQLGFPTANMRIRWDAQDQASLTDEEAAVLDFSKHHDTGIYCAFGCVEGMGGAVHKVAMSMGWNPTFTDVKAKTIEPWILHDFAEDFYGHHLRLLVLGYVRPEIKFGSVEELIAEIRADGDFCSALLDSPELSAFREDPFLRMGDSGGGAGGGLRPASTASPAAPAGLPHGLGFAVGAELRAALAAAPAPRSGCARLLLARHAEAQANEEGRLCGGGSDSELTATGRLQAERLAEELAAGRAELRLDLVGSSPLRRAADSAVAVARRFPGVERLALEDLREMAYGSLEGARIADVRGGMSAVAQQWRSGQTGQRVGGAGESPEDVARRALSAVAALLEGRAGQTVLLVCHTWVIKALVASVVPSIGLPRLLDVPQRNCAVNILDFRCGGEGTLTERFEVLGVDLVASEGPGVEGRL